ncbi:hypothetical protein LZ198_34455 [Myxococcus sp. K15C18031901]|uniref:hypothetical protein n=1 Tax=Myxococcus dinghuensis TaxID=2906761 RepID=UPI0020A75336|nr:hypothetical protein [Myxococcus dinghuensis]MCP3103988.1 hypothetical protein [Myxococcus dinghuensis]
MTAFDRYRALLRKLLGLRARHPEGDSPEEDVLLDDMDEVWAEMTESERAAATAERARILGLPEPHGTDSAPPPQG